jgi:geranylgeranylglycerol-phosphate geranylgeranyltransferase
MVVLDRKIKGMIQLLRPELPFSTGTCVLLGEIVALGSFPSVSRAILGFVCGFFISGSALISNDYFDLEVDRINAPKRPLPSGSVSPLEALLLAALAMAVGLIASSALGIHALILSFVFGVVGILYNWRFKQEGLLGNMMVASCVAITFILGGIAVGIPFNKIVWFFSLTAFLIDLGEEIAGDAMDIKGDKQRNSKSIAIIHGKDFALRISGGIFFLLALIGFIPYIFGWLGIVYLIIISFASVITGISAVKLIQSRTPDEGYKYMRWIYLSALIGMLAYIAAQFFA